MHNTLVFPSITTHSRQGSTWREKVAELEPLAIRNVGLFVTGIQKAERKELYRALLEVKRRHDFSIPFVHAVSDMDDVEYAFLRADFGTRWFNLHPLREFPLLQELSDETRRYITIENSCFVDILRREDLDGFAGLTIDISHLEDARLANPEGYQHLISLCLEFPVRANHISASIKPAWRTHRGLPQHSAHRLVSEGDMDYLRLMPRHVVGEVAALELENSLSEQLRVVKSVRESLSALQLHPHRLAA